MKCIKTGLRFQIATFNDDDESLDNDESTYHGDLFYNAVTHVMILRGVAQQTSTMTPDAKLHSVGDAYAFDNMTKALRDMFTIYVPEIDMSKTYIIISDTRFF